MIQETMSAPLQDEREATAVSLFLARAARHPERVAMRVLEGARAGDSLTWGGWAGEAWRFAAALIRAGHRPGEPVAILAGNGPAWPIADLGALLAGGVGVGIYPTSAPAQLAQILADCGAGVLVVDSGEQLAKARAVRAAAPTLRTIVCWEGAPAPGGAEVEWEAWLATGGDPAARAEAERRAAAVRPADAAILIYTSGSTGAPKGARIPHRYLAASTASIAASLGLREGDSSLSFLPYCHAAERVFGLYTRIRCGMEAGLLGDHAEVYAAARRYGPTVFGGLPRFYEKVYEALRAEEAGARGAVAGRWGRVVELGRRRSRLRRAGEPVPPTLEVEWAELGAPLFARVRAYFGGRVRVATSGGAAFPTEVAEYLDALGLTVLGAYGLTEHLCVAFNRADRYTFDSAGPPMPGTELRIAADGEILVRRGPLTFDGYHGLPGATRAAFSADGEWLLTGDLGSLDSRGMLRVTGRKKELIALSTGKKVAPLPIEARLVEEPWISQAVLYGEGRKFVTALLALRRHVVEGWARERGLDPADPTLLSRPELLAEVQGAVDRVNAALSRPERVRRWILLARELSAERDELTPTLKVRRPVIAQRYGADLDALYLLPEP